MSNIYVFDSDFYSDSSDFSTMGLAGALMPTECTFKEEANGESSIEMTHPVDEYGKYQYLQRGNILIVPVPTNTSPLNSSDPTNTTVWYYVVKDELEAPESLRTLYKSKTGTDTIRVLKGGTKVTVVEKDTLNTNNRWKVKCSAGTGYMSQNGLDLTSGEEASSYKTASWAASPWKLVEQPFRIYSCTMKLDEVQVKARHISYDLIYNTTSFKSDGRFSCSTVLQELVNKSFGRNAFTLYTNLPTSDKYQRTGFDFSGKNLIECLLDEDDGICAMFNLYIVRDWTDIGLLTDPGMNRGITIDYGRNMTGITMESNEEDVVTRIIPTGETEEGDKLYLDDDPNECYIDSDLVNAYSVPHCYELSCENCKVGEKIDDVEVTESIAKARMINQARDYLKYSKCDLPDITVKVEYQDIGETEQFARYKDLEGLYLYDFVTINCPQLVYKNEEGQDVTVSVTNRVVTVEWDCILDRMKSIEVGRIQNESDGDDATNAGSDGNSIGNRYAYNRRLGRKDISKVMRSVSKRWNYQIDGLGVENAVINFITMKDDE